MSAWSPPRTWISPRAVKSGRFRQDLFYRLRIVPIRVPALRERREDIPLLVRHFIDHFNKRFRKKFSGITQEALDLLFEHAWPGNVRELKNVVERVMLLETGPEIRPEMLLVSEGPMPQPPTRSRRRRSPTTARISRCAGSSSRPSLRALERTGGNQTQAARLLGVSRDTVRYRIQQFGVKVETRVTAAEQRVPVRIRRGMKGGIPASLRAPAAQAPRRPGHRRPRRAPASPAPPPGRPASTLVEPPAPRPGRRRTRSLRRLRKLAESLPPSDGGAILAGALVLFIVAGRFRPFRLLWNLELADAPPPRRSSSSTSSRGGRT